MTVAQRKLSLSAVLLLASSGAFACTGPSDERYVISNVPPKDVPAGFVVLEVERLNIEPSDQFRSWKKIEAKVLKAIMGSFSAKTVWLWNGYLGKGSWIISSCDRLGWNKGFVLGKPIGLKGTIPTLITKFQPASSDAPTFG